MPRSPAPVARRASRRRVKSEREARNARAISLTHPIQEAIPVWPGDPYPSIEPVATISANGYFLQRLSLGEHSGTHLVAPRTYNARGASVDEIPQRMLVLPALVIDKSRSAARTPDFLLQPSDIDAWENRHGPIERGMLVLLNTGWDARWKEPEEFLNQDRDGQMHFPGFSPQAIEHLLRRGVAGVGIDTHGIDGGLDASYAASRSLLGQTRIALENLAGLGRMPPRGALVFIGALPIVGGSGAPAHVLALVP
jgi:kynurenine formamidase